MSLRIKNREISLERNKCLKMYFLDAIERRKVNVEYAKLSTNEEDFANMIRYLTAQPWIQRFGGLPMDFLRRIFNCWNSNSWNNLLPFLVVRKSEYLLLHKSMKRKKITPKHAIG